MELFHRIHTVMDIWCDFINICDNQNCNKVAIFGAAQRTHAYVSVVSVLFHLCFFIIFILYWTKISFGHFSCRNFAVVLLKIAAEICICLKIEYPQLNLSPYMVMIPIWILLPSTIIYVFINLVKTEWFHHDKSHFIHSHITACQLAINSNHFFYK